MEGCCPESQETPWLWHTAEHACGFVFGLQHSAETPKSISPRTMEDHHRSISRFTVSIITQLGNVFAFPRPTQIRQLYQRLGPTFCCRSFTRALRNSTLVLRKDHEDGVTQWFWNWANNSKVGGFNPRWNTATVTCSRKLNLHSCSKHPTGKSLQLACLQNCPNIKGSLNSSTTLHRRKDVYCKKPSHRAKAMNSLSHSFCILDDFTALSVIPSGTSEQLMPLRRL